MQLISVILFMRESMIERIRKLFKQKQSQPKTVLDIIELLISLSKVGESGPHFERFSEL